MPHRSLAPLAVFACLAATSSAATETFSVLLGGRQIGSLNYAESGQGAELSTVLDHTPLGVADGTFEASSQPVQAPSGEVVRQYIGANDERTISVLLDEGTVTETTIDPKSERTKLSDPARVPAGVVDPAMAFGRFLHAGGCPAPFSMYDGRRVISIATTSSEPIEGGVRCSLDYAVTAGPGHLSPLGISSLAMTLTYSGGTLREVTGRTGPFTLRFAR